jgi:DNA polymerase-3 subunit alpha
MLLILDVETTGLPKRIGKGFPAYNNIHAYDDARMVQLTMMLCNDNLEEIELLDYIIKSDGFSINNSHLHGITEEISLHQGIPFSEIVSVILSQIKKVSHIIAHNIEFDINILKSELFRLGLSDIIEEVDRKKLICTMKETMYQVNIRNQYGVKYPSLAELYYYIFQQKIENAHNSKYDVINLHRIMKYLYEKK